MKSLHDLNADLHASLFVQVVAEGVFLYAEANLTCSTVNDP